MLVKLMTSENDKSHGSMMLRVGAIAFGLGTLIYTGLGMPPPAIYRPIVPCGHSFSQLMNTKPYPWKMLGWKCIPYYWASFRFWKGHHPLFPVKINSPNLSSSYWAGWGGVAVGLFSYIQVYVGSWKGAQINYIPRMGKKIENWTFCCPV